MFKRLLSPLRSSSFFIFGARGTGKSTFIKQQFVDKNSIYIDLLEPNNESKYALKPQILFNELSVLKKSPSWIIIDEIQKVPKLLDVVHAMIESKKYRFILTGSSARKLKRGAANLLAGRANVYHMYPLSYDELGKSFVLEDVLRWGALPRLYSLNTDREKKSFLNSYVQTYFSEEVRAEQLLRKLEPFRAFLPVLGQVSGKIINHKKIGEEVGVSSLTIQSYFQILEDTLLGFYLPAFHLSVRKSQRLSPKFYLFDTGIKKALEESLDQVVAPRTSVFGDLFESFLINEIIKLNAYHEKGFRLSYYGTKNNVEIDLILTRGKTHFLIEIKSNEKIDETEVKAMAAATETFPNVKRLFYLSRDESHQKIGKIECMNWKLFLSKFSEL